MTSWRISGDTLSFPPPIGVGIVNVTDDSFFSGARSGTPEGAIEDGLRLVADGFRMLDVGAVAARSGPAVPIAEEADRLLPAVEALARRAGVPIAADTFAVEVAEGALDAGAGAINDISGGADPAMLELVGERGCGYVLMHIDGPPRVQRHPPRRADVVDEVRRWFSGRMEEAIDRGVSEDQIALDPGLDFDLSVDQDLELLRRLGELRELGRPLFIALSRKDFIGAVGAGSWEERLPAEEREWGTAAAAALAVAAGAEMVRLHDGSALDAVAVAAAISDSGSAGG